MTQFDWSIVLVLSAALFLRIHSAALVQQKSWYTAIFTSMLSWVLYGAALVTFLRKFTGLF